MWYLMYLRCPPPFLYKVGISIPGDILPDETCKPLLRMYHLCATAGWEDNRFFSCLTVKDKLNSTTNDRTRYFSPPLVGDLPAVPFPQVFRRLARPARSKDGGGHSAARDNALVFLRGHLGPAPSSWDRDRRKAFRKRVKGACRLIEAIVTADELG